MLRTRYLTGGVAALVVGAALTACTDHKDLVNPPPPVNRLFTTYVALGNSITAGFQSSGINDSTQQEAYPVLLAHQMGTRFAIPALQAPGCPPPIANFLTQMRVGDTTTSRTCALRADVTGTMVINNVAVPGSFVADLTDPTAPEADNGLSTLILGGKSQVTRALDANPTFASLWIGNNDVLAPALSGILVPVPGVSPGITDTTAFKASYAKILSALTASKQLKGGILIGVVNVTAAPIFFPAAALQNPQVIGAIDQATGRSVTIDTSCTPATQSLINFEIVPAIATGVAPDTIACHALANHANLLGNLYVLDASEIGTIAAVVSSYNAYIAAKADSLGWAFVDPNPTLAQLRADTSVVPVFPRLNQPTAPFGAYISLDGIHPAAAAHQLVTNLLIDAINAKYGTSIPKLAQ